MPGDIVVCDNARIYTGFDCTYLWDDIQRIRYNGSRYLDYIRRQDNVILKQCCDVLDNLTHHDITSVYRKCGYL